MILALLAALGGGLEARADEPVTFPLTVGDRWSWKVVHRRGGGPRLLFIPLDPGYTAHLATWELTIDHQRPDGRFQATRTQTPAGGLPASTPLVLWHDRDGALWMEGPKGPTLALEVATPPGPLSIEQVRCVAHFLDGLAGVCSPAPGGPLDVAPGPLTAVLRDDGKAGQTVLQIAVGISTAGVFIPGNRRNLETLVLDTYQTSRPSAPSPLVQAWKRKPDPAALPALLKKTPPSAEEAAALVSLGNPRQLLPITRAVLAALPRAERPSVLRVALQTTDDLTAEELLAHFAAEVPHRDEAVRLSLLAQFPDARRPVAEALLDGRWPTLAAFLRSGRNPPDRLAALGQGAQPISTDEARAILSRTDDPACLDRVLARAVDQDAVLFDWVDNISFDDKKTAFYESRPELLAKLANNPALASRALAIYSFDAGRAALLTRLLPLASHASGRATLLRITVEAMGFDNARIEALQAHPSVVAELSRADKTAILAAFDFASNRARAQELLGR